MNIIKLLIIPFIILFFTACGGGGGGDADGNGIPSNSVLLTAVESFSSSSSDGNITLAITSPNSADVSITVENIKLLADSYNITITSITPSSVTFNDLNLTKTIQISFTYVGALGSSDITLSDIKFSYTKVVASKLSNTQISTNELDENFGLQSSSPIKGSSALLKLIAYAPVTTVNTANQSIEITLQVNDLNTSPSKPAVGEQINIEPISPADGGLDSFSKTTDTNGRVTFTYTSSDIPKYGTNLNLTIYSDKYPDVKTVVTLNFTAQAEEVVANMYLAPSDFIVTSAGETKTIKIVTVNSQNIGMSTHLTIEQLNNADNVDYGSFNTTSLTTDASGSGSIIYTAPSDISALSNRSITVREDSANIQKTLQVNFAQTSTDANVTAYEINTIIPNSTSLNSDGTFVINIQKVGNPNIFIANADVKDVNISTQFGQQLSIVNNNYNSASTKNIDFTTHSLSGTVIVDISARVFDGTKDVILTTSVPVTILSGPVAAVSLFYVSTAYDSDLGIFKDKYTIHSVDKYSNPVNSGVQLYPTLLNSFKIVSGNGEILTNGNTSFKDSFASFLTDVNLGTDEDHLIILPSPNAFNKAYLGGWTISSVGDNNNLTLNEDYYGVDTSSLSYIIGNKSRFVGDTVALADIQSTTGSYLTDENGNVQFIVTYDPMLVGHTLSLSAVAYDNSRSGIALRSNFRGQGYSYSAENVANDGATHNSTISIAILPSGSGPLANVNIVPSSVSVSPIEECTINQATSDFTTDKNGQFTVEIITKGTTDANGIVTEKTCTVSWNPNNSSIFYEY